MPSAVSVTFRDQTTGRINDLLQDEGQASAPTQNLLGYLAGALISYKDEGNEFTPSLVLCDRVANFLTAFPGAVSHKIGTASFDPASGAKVLKDCAPLSGASWSIYIERVTETELNYGVFTYFRRPTAIPLYEGITINPGEFCILIRKVGVNTIEMRGAKGSILTLIFSTSREATDTVGIIEKFGNGCCSALPDDNTHADFRKYLFRLLQAALTSSHGAMMLCAENLGMAEVPELSDTIPIAPSLDFRTAYQDFETTKSADSILALQRCEELLSGFLRCDGMTMFDTRGSVIAYRMFFKPVGQTVGAAHNIVGGARMRAFEGVKTLVGHRLRCVLFRSQDGLTLHHGVE